jgi:tetratricopeptide (TPR) repeat protein
VLNSLVSLEFFYIQPGPIYVFKHALTHEIAYSRIPRAERQLLHLAAGRALESLAPHRIAELARHWDQTDDHLKAIAYAARFVHQTTARYALSEALTASQRALTHCNAMPPGQDRDRLTLTTAMQVAVPLTLLGRTSEIKDVLQPHLPLVERLDDSRLSAPFFLALTLAADHTADHEAAETFGARAIGEARRYDDRIIEGRTLVMLAFSSLWTSRHRLGVERARRAFECLPSPSEGFWRGHGLYLASQLLLMLGDLKAAIRMAEELREVGDAIGDRRLQAYGLVMSAMEAMIRGDAVAALQGAQDALEVAADPLARANVLGYLGEIASTAGDTSLAKESLMAALDFSRGAHFRQLEAWELARLAEAELCAGDIVSADAVARDAVDLADAVRFPYVRARASQVRGQVAFRSGLVLDAIDLLMSTAAIFERIEAPYEWARTALSLAAAYTVAGHKERGERLREDAFQMATRIGARLPATE